MFEIKMIHRGKSLYVRHCDKGELLPTIAAMLQDFEAEHGMYRHQDNYALQWRRVKE